MQDKNLILNFSNVYEPQMQQNVPDAVWIDCSGIMGCDMYCTPAAARQIRQKLLPYGINGIHFIDSGNYHYVTKFFLEKIKETFALVLFDFHNDMQQPRVHEFLSCGGWAAEVLRTNPCLKQLLLAGPDEKATEEAEETCRKKLICISLQNLQKQQAEEQILKIEKNIPVYISIDKDVLSKTYARTNWNQGEMSLDTMEGLLSEIMGKHEVLGVDICGAQDCAEPFYQYRKDQIINRQADKKLFSFFMPALI